MYHIMFRQLLTGPCDNLPPLINGMITYNTSQGLHTTVATYTCNDGFTLLGSHLRICKEAVWEEASPSCLQDGKVYNTMSFKNCTTVCTDHGCYCLSCDNVIELYREINTHCTVT